MGSCSVVSAGVLVVDHLAATIPEMPLSGHLVVTDDIFLSLGGCAANVSVALSRLGIDTALAACVGKDTAGQFAEQELSSQGVCLDHLTRLDDVSTAQTLVVNVRSEDRRFIHHYGANAHFQTEHIPADLVAGSKVLYVGGLFLLPGLDCTALAEVFRIAQEAGVKTVLDVVTPGPGAYLRPLQEILPFTNVFLPNRDEGVFMTGQGDPREQTALYRDLGAELAIVTCGENGAVVRGKGLTLHCGIYDVLPVDATGGGDAFDAGFIFGLVEGAPLERCLAYGSAMGASCVQRVGATTGLFTRAELEKFVGSQPFKIENF